MKPMTYQVTVTQPSAPRAAVIGTNTSLNLRAGEWVRVRTLEEIAATLDENASLDGLPFMPEMVQYCGRRFRVYKSAHKTCDTINHYAIRRMNDAVHLDGLRCDGQGHDGCQAGCLIFWKDRWLERVPGDQGTEDPAGAETPAGPSWELLRESTRAPLAPGETERRYRCQATDLLKATTDVRRRDRWDPRLYVKDLTSRNVTIAQFIKYGLLAMVNAFTLRWRGTRYPHLCGMAGNSTPTAKTNLQAGELVQVRSKDEILQTVNGRLLNRGLSFDVEMVRFCGSQQRVLRRVERIVDEKTGRMIRLPNPAIILDGVACSGNLSTSRMFCPRAIYPYFREIWLQRADGG
jgi:hypothetical protein